MNATMSGAEYLQVNDIYQCIQGEGALAGTPMALVRLQGCGVGCPFCDTKETWKALGRYKVLTIAEARQYPPHWCWMTPAEVAAECRKVARRNDWVLLTGGEPSEHDLKSLVATLKAEGFDVCLETSGTARGHLGCEIDWCCVSPKLGMPGGKPVLHDVLAMADEIKLVVAREADLTPYEALLDLLPEPPECVSVQPVAGSLDAQALAVRLAKERGWRLSLQLHKFLGEP